MHREVQPEILDSLPETHPDALSNRRDLSWINFFMGNFRWLSRIVTQHAAQGEQGMEIGAGTGELGSMLRRKQALPPGCTLAGLDLSTRPEFWPCGWDWRSGDITAFAGYRDYDFLLGNLILHQFSDPELLELGTKLQSLRFIALCEPARRKRHFYQLFLLNFLGLHPVSWHDGRVSIRAGFLGRELPELLGLDPLTWSIQCTTTFLGAYRMLAIRRKSPKPRR
ncbi:MAG: class I SAM-dependent methyltransferase [Opitutales bacterium]